MADTPVEFFAPSGLSLSLDLFLQSAPDVLVATYDPLELTNAKGFYLAFFSGAIVGRCNAIARLGAVPIAAFEVDMLDDEEIHRPLPTSLLDAIIAKTNTIGTGSAVVVSPVNAGGRLTLYQGVDYLESFGRSIDLVDADGSILPAAGSDLRLQARHPGRTDAFEVDGTVIDPADGSLIARFDVPRAEAADLHPDARYAYFVYELLSGGTLRRLDITGTLDLRRGVLEAA